MEARIHQQRKTAAPERNAFEGLNRPSSPVTAAPLSLDSLREATGFSTIILGASLLRPAANANDSEREKLYRVLRDLNCSAGDWERALEFLLNPDVSCPKKWRSFQKQAELLKQELHAEMPEGVRGYLRGTHNLSGQPFPIDHGLKQTMAINQLVVARLPVSFSDYPLLKGNVWTQDVTKDTLEAIVKADYFGTSAMREELAPKSEIAEDIVRRLATYKFLAHVAVQTAKQSCTDRKTLKLIKNQAKLIIIGVASQPMLRKEIGHEGDVLDSIYSIWHSKSAIDLNGYAAFVSAAQQMYLALDEALVAKHTSKKVEFTGLFQTSSWIRTMVDAASIYGFRHGGDKTVSAVTTIVREGKEFFDKFYEIPYGKDWQKRNPN